MTYAEAKRRARKEFGLNGHVWTVSGSSRGLNGTLPRLHLVGTFLAENGKKTLVTLGVGPSWEAAFESAMQTAALKAVLK